MSYQKRTSLLDIISEYKSDNLALKSQITDLKKQLQAKVNKWKENQKKKKDSSKNSKTE